MQDRELKEILLQTCPVRPGQEARAWAALKERLDASTERSSEWTNSWSWLYYSTWRGAIAVVAVLLLLPIFGSYVWSGLQPRSLATADSQVPGIYATAFYSRPAQAQVVWLNGLDVASDKPSYLDPTTEVRKPAPPDVSDPNSL